MYKKGDRVILIRLLPEWKPSLELPLWRSAHASIGTVIDVGVIMIRVEWDSGISRYYRATHLYLYQDYIQLYPDYVCTKPKSAVNPNKAFAVRKMSEARKE